MKSAETPAAAGLPHREGFDQVFRRLLPDAVRMARRIVGNETMAEDAAAEAFSRAHMAWRKICRAEYRDAWIMRVTANVAVDMCRRRRRVFSAGLSIAAEAGEDRTDADTARLALAAALAALPRRQREVLILRYLEGFSEDEVARALGISIGTVKKSAFRARETLRIKLGHEFAT